MNRIYQVGPILGCIVFAASAPAAVTDPQPHSIIVCHSPVATREIRTYHTGNGGCRVDYLKDATTLTLWSASSDRGYCDMRVNDLAATLARGNFSCNAIGVASLDAAPTSSDRSEERRVGKECA